MSDKPNVVLVHGGFVDGSGSQGVYGLLTADGSHVRLPGSSETFVAYPCERDDYRRAA